MVVKVLLVLQGELPEIYMELTQCFHMPQGLESPKTAIIFFQAHLKAFPKFRSYFSP